MGLAFPGRCPGLANGCAFGAAQFIVQYYPEHLVRAAYERGQPVDKEFLRKTAKLVQKHTESGAIEDPTKFQALTVAALEAIADSKQPDTVKVFNLLKALDQTW